MAAAPSYSTNNFPLIPFYIFYSMFGFQRIGDFAWAAGDMRTRGFFCSSRSRAHRSITLPLATEDDIANCTFT